MSKVISFRLEDEAAMALDERVQAAGVSRADFFVGLLAGTADVPESEKIATMLAKSIEQDGVIAGLREEIKDLKRKVRAGREPESGLYTKSKDDETPETVYNQKKPDVYKPAAPHVAHSGLYPRPGCDDCAAMARADAKGVSRFAKPGKQ